MALVAGIDFGTGSVRVSIVDSERGRLGVGSAEYEVLRRSQDPDFATQRHADRLSALTLAFRIALGELKVHGREIQALALDTTGSSVAPLDGSLRPLGDAHLWSDHRARREAAEITAKAHEFGLGAIRWCGGAHSSEWGFAKLLHWLRSNPESRARFYTAAEHCDLMVATLCGVDRAEDMVRSVCAMGLKWMWNRELGGLPPDEFLRAVDPLLSGLRARLDGRYLTADRVAGVLSSERRAALYAGPVRG